MIDHSERYRNATKLLTTHLDDLIENIDPVIYNSGIGRNLIAQTLINKSLSILMEELDTDVTYRIFLSLLNNRLYK